MASSRTPLDWFTYQVGMAAFRAFAEGKPTWILNYSWDGDQKVDASQSMQNLAMSQLMVGANFWDAAGHSMSGSNHLPTRRRIFRWIEQHQDVFYQPRRPVDPVGVYFSPSTRNYFAEEFISSFRGVVILLMQRHLEYQIVTPRTLRNFAGTTLVLPNVRVLDEDEKAALRAHVDAGKTLVINGTDATGLSSPKVVRFPNDSGRAYMHALERDFQSTSPELQSEFLRSLKRQPGIDIKASPFVATHIAEVNGELCTFLANFHGLQAHSNPVQIAEAGARIMVSGKTNSMRFLPFLGEPRELKGTQANGKLLFALPPIEKGAVACVKLDAQ
jgi:hypothetical protein